MYLQHAIKMDLQEMQLKGSLIQGTTMLKLVECLKARFDRPRLIHRTHVQMVIEAPSLKDDSGKELHCLHDNIQQHIRDMKTLESDLHNFYD